MVEYALKNDEFKTSPDDAGDAPQRSLKQNSVLIIDDEPRIRSFPCWLW